MSTGRASLLAKAILVVFALLTAWSAMRVPLTIDEPLYLTTGRVLTREANWDNRFLRMQGPLPLYFNQTWLASVPDEQYQARPREAWRARARLGMLPVGLATCWLVWRFARRLYGEGGGLLALCAYALHPLMPGYAALLNVDQTHALFTLLCAYSLWRYAECKTTRSHQLWALATGLGLGGLLATKYLAVLSAPVVLLALLGFALGSTRQHAWWKRAWQLLGTALLAGLGATLALHAAYQFQGGWAWSTGEAWEGSLVRALMNTPIASTLLGMQPLPWVQGLGMMTGLQEVTKLNYLAGALAPTHPLYFPLSIAAKSPEPWLLLALIAAWRLGSLSMWASARLDEKRAARVLLPLIVVPAAYLCLLANIQPGVRYIYQLLPLVCVPMGWVATWKLWSSRPRMTAILTSGTLAFAALELSSSAPDWISYFNRSSGGQAHSYRIFRDSNNDFGQNLESGRQSLRSHQGEDCYLLAAGEGPRSGRLAVYVADFAPPDPRDPTRARHWLDVFQPVDHVAAAWFVYELNSENWVAAARASSDERVGRDASLALAGAGELARAQALLEQLREPVPTEQRELFELLSQSGNAPSDPAACLQLALAWLRNARPDLCQELLRGIEGPQARTLEANALLARGQALEAARLLDEPELLAADPTQRLVAAEAYLRAGFELSCLRLLEPSAKLPEALATMAQGIAARARSRVEQAHALGLLLPEEY